MEARHNQEADRNRGDRSQGDQEADRSPLDRQAARTQEVHLPAGHSHREHQVEDRNREGQEGGRSRRGVVACPKR